MKLNPIFKRIFRNPFKEDNPQDGGCPESKDGTHNYLEVKGGGLNSLSQSQYICACGRQLK